MTSAAIVELADAIVADFNAAAESESELPEFSQEFTAVRVWKPEFALEQIASALEVAVVAIGETSEIADRSRSLLVTYQIDVGVLKKIDLAENDAADDLAFLVQQIADFYRTVKRPTGRTETWIGTQVFLPDEEMLRKREFAGIARLSFRGMR